MDEASDAEKFFRARLGDVDEPTAPFGLLDMQGEGGHVKEARAAIDTILIDPLHVQAHRLGVSVASLFHAAWGLIISRTSGRDDVVYGTVLLREPVRGSENQRATEASSNALPLRLRLQGVTVANLASQTHKELTELSRQRHASSALAQRCSTLVGAVPLFSALLNYRDEVNHQGLADREWMNFPLALSVHDLPGQIVLTMQTHFRLDPRRLLDYVHTALRVLVQALEDAPETPALALPILPEWEFHRITDEFNATRTSYSRAKRVHELFEEQARRTPSAVAVEHEGRTLTYAELNSKANQLARYLRALDVGPDRLVAVCLERGLELVISLMGILKAGGAYLPLDPNYPAERLQYMLEDAAPQVVLIQDELRSILPQTKAEVISLDTTLWEICAHVDEDLAADELGLTAQSLVYVIYTSGSTGRPKGTAMAHGSMVNLMEWHREGLCSAGGHRVLQFAALSFDVAFQEVFSTLCTGSTLILVDDWIRRDSMALAGFVNSRCIQRLFLPPLMLQSSAESFAALDLVPASLLDVITAGEQLHISPEISRLFTRLSGCRLHNHYGPTETHVVTAWTLQGEPSKWPILPPIGRPISNARIYVLNQELQPVPIGIAGEICIGGAGVARGYLRKPELTRERFIDDPFSVESKGRLYRTGDIGRFDESGTLEYLGRRDSQVKIHGYRIELGEIEAQLARHEAVKEAVVVPRDDFEGEKRLVAYITRREPSTASAEELRAHLKLVLPQYMIPSALLILEHWPLTPNGKLDRRRLPAPQLADYASKEFEVPLGDTEVALADIWRSLLRADRVGRGDHFFQLGGNSLTCMKLTVRIAERFSIQVPAHAVVKYPSLKEMALHIEERLSMRRQPSSFGERDVETITI